jgi:hypothetical protein
METITKISAGANAVLLTMLMVMGSGMIGQDNVYACESLNTAMVCDSLSKANLEGIQSRCYFVNDKNISTYKTCNSGWIKFENQKIQIVSNLSDYICGEGEMIKECKNNEGKILLRIKND